MRRGNESVGRTYGTGDRANARRLEDMLPSKKGFDLLEGSPGNADNGVSQFQKHLTGLSLSAPLLSLQQTSRVPALVRARRG